MTYREWVGLTKMLSDEGLWKVEQVPDEETFSKNINRIQELQQKYENGTISSKELDELYALEHLML